MAQNANITTNWTQEYSRKPSISSASYYPSSDTGSGPEVDPEIDEDEDTWSEVFEEPAKITEYIEDKEKTPIQTEVKQCYDDYNFVKSTARPQQPPVEKLWKNYGEIVEKRPPTVAMARRSSTEHTIQPPRRSDMEVKLYKEMAERSYEQSQRPASRSGSYESSSQRTQQPQRPASRAAMISYENTPQPQRPASRAGMRSYENSPQRTQQQQPPRSADISGFLSYETQQQDSRAGIRSYENSPQRTQQQPPRSVSRADMPGFLSYETTPQSQRPASRAGIRSYENSPQRPQPRRPASRAEVNYPRQPSPAPSSDIFELSRSPSSTSTATVLSDTSSIGQILNPDKISSSPHKGQKCPHCNIHSWLPHSPNCPKKK